MQFRDLGAQYQRLEKEILSGARSVMEQSHFILGPQVDELEAKLAAYVGVKHCISCANGTDALQLVLMAWGIGPGDAVFTSDFTFFASAGTASIVGATPVFVDIDPDTFNISPDALEGMIQRTLNEERLKPRVIVPVDLFGQPAEYDRIEAIAEKYGLLILEDGAQGFGGDIGGKRVGSFGDAATTSFFPAKPLGCYGDGGAIFTNDDDLEVLLRSLRAQGRSPEDKYDNRLIGMNSRLDTLQAAILLPKLKAFEEYELDAVNKVAAWYDERLKDIVKIPVVKEGYLSSWAQYTITLKNKAQRDGLQKHLKDCGIPSMVYYPKGLHQQTAYRDLGLSDDLYPNTVKAVDTVLSLPMHPYLSWDEVEDVSDAVSHYIK
ncbi:MAG: DegT/DnrJ/EryC1/StrS family aminotransferase [Chloroflexi bacterium]|nr:DegT/DnrJ/EryC1/StrS family aminotransferase [Chloroflexota bacterium]